MRFQARLQIEAPQKRVKEFFHPGQELARISHTQSTAAADMAASTAFRSVGLLNVPYSTFAGASVARGAPHSDRSFRRFATTWCEKSGQVRVLVVKTVQNAEEVTSLK